VKPPFRISWEEVTPAIAREWLTKNAKNRNLRETTVMAFARDMARDAWSENHQAIAFGADGELIDGQHRLAAIVKSGRSIRFLVIKDVPRSSMVVATCNMIAMVAIQEGLDRVKRVSVPTVLAIAERYREGLAYVVKNRSTVQGLRSAPVCAAVAFAYAAAPKKTEDFYKRFSLGTGLDEESPILVLRNYLLNEGGIPRGSSRSRLDLAEAVLHTLYAFANQKAMPRLPKTGQRSGADWFRRQQLTNVAFLDSLFPSLAAAPIDAKTFKMTEAADALVRGKIMSDRLKGKPVLSADDFRG
jgi:hypothetical protein